ncbi:MAG: PASTA domain-containing protein, partial [Gemmatimonadaceae bacterium]
PAKRHKIPVSQETRRVPDVRGLPLRQAVLALHAAGFRVQINGFGSATSTSPGAGTVAKRGSLVKLTSAR